MTHARLIYTHVKDIKSMHAVAKHFAVDITPNTDLNMTKYEFDDGSALYVGETVIHLPEAAA